MANEDQLKRGNTGVRGWLREMIGKSEPLSQLYATFTGFMGIQAKLTFDYSKVTYSLTRALFYASTVIDRKTGKKYGGKYLYGAIFAKPIIDSIAAFVIGQTPTIDTDVSDADSEAQNLMNEFLSDNDGKIYRWIRDGGRDGDSYLRINKDMTVDRIAPEIVDKIVDPITGLLEGYDLIWAVANAADPNKQITIKEMYRTVDPFYQKLQIASDGTETVLVGPKQLAAGEVAPTKSQEIRLLPIVHLANEQEANEIYGNSEFQNVYLLMATYHQVFEAWVKNNIFNNTSIPVITGVKNPAEFMALHGVKGRDGKYRVNWKGDTMMVIGEGGDAKFLTTDSGVGTNSDLLLSKLLTLISIASETPEFFLGKEMNASFASVKQQMPVMIKKAERKQKEYTPAMNDLIDVVFETMKRNGDLKTIPTYKFVWGKVIDDDLDLNMKIVDLLKREGIITDHTALVLTGIGKYVDDIDAEIQEAKNEATQATDNIFASTPAVIQQQIDRIAAAVKKQPGANPPTPPTPPAKPKGN